jgi:hypothetical protein
MAEVKGTCRGWGLGSAGVWVQVGLQTPGVTPLPLPTEIQRLVKQLCKLEKTQNDHVDSHEHLQWERELTGPLKKVEGLLEETARVTSTEMEAKQADNDSEDNEDSSSRDDKCHECGRHWWMVLGNKCIYSRNQVTSQAGHKLPLGVVVRGGF